MRIIRFCFGDKLLRNSFQSTVFLEEILLKFWVLLHMSGIGGPLLCIGDLLSDVGEDGDFTIGTVSDESTNGGRTGQQLNDLSDPNKLQPSHLPQLFQVRLFCLYLVDFYFSIFFGTYNELFSSSCFVCVCVCVEFVNLIASRLCFFIGFIIHFSWIIWCMIFKSRNEFSYCFLGFIFPKFSLYFD